MNEKEQILKNIGALSFAAHELELFLDTHPQNRQAMSMLSGYRKYLSEAIALYESKFGKLILNIGDSDNAENWDWLSSP